MRVTLRRLTDQDRERFSTLSVRPEQLKFSGTAAEAFDEDPARFDLHGILYGDTPVSLFKIDRAYHKTIPIVPGMALGLRAFLIDQTRQGQGLATASVRRLAAHLKHHYPDRPSVALTVNHTNAAARACYLNGGFEDTGQDWHKGQAGPQDLLVMPLHP